MQTKNCGHRNCNSKHKVATSAETTATSEPGTGTTELRTEPRHVTCNWPSNMARSGAGGGGKRMLLGRQYIIKVDARRIISDGLALGLSKRKRYSTTNPRQQHEINAISICKWPKWATTNECLVLSGFLFVRYSFVVLFFFLAEHGPPGRATDRVLRAPGFRLLSPFWHSIFAIINKHMARQFISGCWRPSHGKSIKQSLALKKKGIKNYKKIKGRQ